MLLERESALAALDEWLTEAGSGAGRMVLLGGEAGIGKTTLVQAMVERHSSQVQVWWGACDPLSTPRPLGPLHDIAGRAGGELAAAVAGDRPRHVWFSHFRDALVSPLHPVVVVVEDVHWADEATRDLLVYLARRVPGTHALVLVTYRDDGLGTAHPLQGVLGHLATLPAVRRQSLHRLSEAAVAELATGHPVDPAWVYEVTGGNPFFVTELLATGITDAVPASVSDAVQARVARLSGPGRAALEAAAVVPGRAELALVQTVAGVSAAAVDECERAGLLATSGGWVRFRHELARRAVEQVTSGAWRQELHGRVLEQLDKRAVTDLPRLAYHGEQAGDRDAVLAYAPAAAQQASQLGAHHEAHRHLGHALEHRGSLPPAEQAELLERYATECEALGLPAAAADAIGQARDLWRQLGETDHVARMAVRQARSHWDLGQGEQAQAAVGEAVALLAARPASPAHAYVLARAANLRSFGPDLAGAIELGTRAAELAERFGDDRELAAALFSVGTAEWATDPDQAEATLRRALALARRARHDVGVGSVLGNLGSGAAGVRRYRTAEHWLRECLTWSEARDLDNSWRHARAWQARVAFEQSRWPEAGALARELMDRSTDQQPVRTGPTTVLGRLRARRGDPDPDSVLAEAWRLAVRVGQLQRLWPVAAARAEAAWLAGRPDQIPELVRQTYQQVCQAGHPWAIGELAFWLWRAGELAAPPERAAEPYARQIRGDWSGAAAAWERIGCPYEVALARVDSDHPDDLRAALDGFARLGARPMADRVAARLRTAGVRHLPRRPAQATVDNPGGLTDRELEVLALLVDGCTDAQVAARLHIAVKTAGHHVSAILAKLEVRSRGDAARVARDRGIGSGGG